MKRIYDTFLIKDVHLFKLKLLHWTSKFAIGSFLNNHGYASSYSTYECLAGVGCIKKFNIEKDFFSSISSFVNDTPDWIFGHLNYDIKNYIEDLYSQNIDNIIFPDAFLFVPETVLFLQENQLTVGTTNGHASAIFDDINLQQIPAYEQNAVSIIPRLSKEEYIRNIQQIQQDILRGECYEINYCQEFFATNTVISPAIVYQLLTNISPNPFSTFYKIYDKFLLCASPERYIRKEGESIISQPIKGTAKRGESEQEDQQV